MGDDAISAFLNKNQESEGTRQLKAMTALADPHDLLSQLIHLSEKLDVTMALVAVQHRQIQTLEAHRLEVTNA